MECLAVPYDSDQPYIFLASYQILLDYSLEKQIHDKRTHYLLERYSEILK